VTAAWIERASAVIADRVWSLPGIRSARRVALYLAMPREVQTEGLIRRLAEAGAMVSVPAWDPNRSTYGLAGYTPDSPTAAGPAGAQEPQLAQWVDIQGIDGWIVPALAFDRGGGRLGRGGGVYDRLLRGRRGVAIGIGFSFQLTTRVPREPHDEEVDFVVTECEVVDCRTARTNLR
jgi:5-formyltetrahydrofolate cyclo-ligase